MTEHALDEWRREAAALRERIGELSRNVDALRINVEAFGARLTALRAKLSEQEDRVRALDRGMRRGYPRGL